MPRLLGLLVPLALLAAGCGDDDGATPATTTTSAPATTIAEDEPEASGDDAEAPDDADASTTAEPGVPTDSPAGDGAGDAGEGDGMGDALLVADLDSGEEVPGPGAVGASGRFEGEIVDGVLCIDMAVRDLGDVVVGAHVHEGAAGSAGPVLVDLGEPTAMDPSSATWTDACTEVADEVIERLAASPDQHYVNVHTPGFPEGAVRGQLAIASIFDRTLD